MPTKKNRFFSIKPSKLHIAWIQMDERQVDLLPKSFNISRGHCGYGLSQWQTTLHCNVGCHWLSQHKDWSLYIHSEPVSQEPVSLRLMTSQLKDIVTHAQKYMTVKCTFCGVWVQNFVWNFKGALWNFTQNSEPIHRQICILWGGKKLTTDDILELWHIKS